MNILLIGISIFILGLVCSIYSDDYLLQDSDIIEIDNKSVTYYTPGVGKHKVKRK